ncbi:hypothetical protein D1872_308090 [compost metagenome]
MKLLHHLGQRFRLVRHITKETEPLRFGQGPGKAKQADRRLVLVKLGQVERILDQQRAFIETVCINRPKMNRRN